MNLLADTWTALMAELPAAIALARALFADLTDPIMWFVAHAHYFLPLLAAIFAAAFAYRVNVRNKRFDVILSCNTRYDVLYQDRVSINDEAGPQSLQVKQYFRRYWGLKSDQLEYWLAGGVDPQTFANWFHSTIRSFSNISRVGGLSYIESWQVEKLDLDIANSSFVDFVDHLLRISQSGMSPDTKYASLLVAMDSIERRERRFNTYLFDGVPPWVRGRLTVKKLIPMLTADVQSNFRKQHKLASLKKA